MVGKKNQILGAIDCPTENLCLEGSKGLERTLTTFIFLASMF